MISYTKLVGWGTRLTVATHSEMKLMYQAPIFRVLLVTVAQEKS